MRSLVLFPLCSLWKADRSTGSVQGTKHEGRSVKPVQSVGKISLKRKRRRVSSGDTHRAGNLVLASLVLRVQTTTEGGVTPKILRCKKMLRDFVECHSWGGVGGGVQPQILRCKLQKHF